MLVHNYPDFAVRIINALDEPMHNFVIHVDANADAVQEHLQQVFAHRSNVYIITEGREVISWGGFSIVNATLTATRYAWDLGLPFHYMMDISGTTYPLKSNRFIRKSLAENPNAVFSETHATPVRPEGPMWNQFVECDGLLHRIGRIPLPRGINMHVSSQWFAVPRHYVYWLLHSALPREYNHYAQYIIIADENYFATMLHNSPYCEAEIKRTLVFLLFDKWEHERNITETGKPRDNRKCLGVGEQNCGRSPTTLTMDYKNLIGSSRMLFARKFDPDNPKSMELLQYIDDMRGTYGNVSAEVTERWDTNKDDVSAVSAMIRVGDASDSISRSGSAASSNSSSSNAIPITSTLLSTATATELPPSTAAAESRDAPVVAPTDPAESSAAPRPPRECLIFSVDSPHYIKRAPCDPGNVHQWFTIGTVSLYPRYSSICSSISYATVIVILMLGRCSHGYELELHDHKCPTFRKITNTSSEVTAPASPSDDVFCSILAHWEDKELCFDMAGENPAYGTPVLGYECTGRWNQLFKLTANCAIIVEQPGFIGRVRGRSDETVVSCLDARHESGVLVSAPCTPLPSYTATTASGTTSAGVNMTDEIIVDQTGTTVSDISNTTTSSSSTASRAGVARQQFHFLPASGTAFKKLESVLDTNAA